MIELLILNNLPGTSITANATTVSLVDDSLNNAMKHFAVPFKLYFTAKRILF